MSRRLSIDDVEDLSNVDGPLRDFLETSRNLGNFLARPQLANFRTATTSLNTTIFLRTLPASFHIDNCSKCRQRSRSRKVCLTTILSRHFRGWLHYRSNGRRSAPSKSSMFTTLLITKTNLLLTQARSRRNPIQKPTPRPRPPSRASTRRKRARSDSRPPSTDPRRSSSRDPQNTHENQFLMSPA